MPKRLLALSFLLLITALTVRAAEHAAEIENSSWFDRSHSSLLLRTQKAAVWFDNFFGDSHREEDPASMRTRFTLGWKGSQHNDNDSYARVRVKVRLPNLKERFYLELGNEDSDLPSLPLESQYLQDTQDDLGDEYNAVLSWLKRTTASEKVSVRGGARSGSNIYLLGRYQRYHNLTGKVKLRITPEIFIDSGYGSGSRLLAEFHYLSGASGLIGLSVRGQLAGRSEGLEWHSGLSYTHRLAATEAVVWGFYLQGKTAGDEHVDNYLHSVRLRKQFLRPYLFYEVEPFMNWPAEDGYRTDHGIILNLQIVIGD